MRLAFVAAFAVGLLAFSADAGAGERETVILVAPSGDGFENRMRAELESMGFDVVVQGQLAGTPSGVLAVARIVEGPPRRIEVVVVSTDASLQVPSRTALIDVSATDDESVVSVRAAEQLRAFFQPLRPPSPPPPPLPPPLPPPPPPSAPPSSRVVPIDVLPSPSASPPPLRAIAGAPRRSTERWRVGVAAGVAFDAGDFGVDVLGSARLRLGDWVAVGALVAVPLAGASVSDTEGSARVWTGIAGADLGLALDVAQGALLVIPSVGFAGALLTTRGDAKTPYEGRTDAAVSGMPFARLELAPHLAGPIGLSLQAVVGVATPPVQVRFAEREVATWGAPWALVAGGLDVAW